MFEIEEFVEQCRRALDESEPSHAVRELVAEAVSLPGELIRALGPGGFGQTTYYQSPGLTVQRITWPNGVIAAPHEHLMWTVVGVVQGQEDNELWRRTPVGLRRAGYDELTPGDVLLLDRDAVHGVSNPCRYTTVGLHVYGGDILTTPRSEWDLAGGDEHRFDLDTIKGWVAELEQAARERGRAPEFDEVRDACLAHYGGSR